MDIKNCSDNNCSDSPVNIGNNLELFIDHHLIDSMKGAELCMHKPIKMPRPDSPLTGGYITVIKDENIYRGYYREYKPEYKGEKKDGNPGECTCYTESQDGIEWEKPDLSLIKDEQFGSLKNAILDEPPFAHNFSPFFDTRPGVPQNERFKALAGKRTSGLHAFASGDGIHWKKISGGPVIEHHPESHNKNAFDSQNVAFWSEAEKCYVAYFRHWKTDIGGPRTIGRATSQDFLVWEDESATFKTPNLEGEELYTSQTHPYFRAPHIYVALPTRFTRGFVKGQPLRNEEGTLINKGSTDIMFMTQRAGENSYQRPFKEAFIRPGITEEGWENRANYLALNVVPTGPAEMSLYNRSGDRYALRTDGFASVNAPYAGGELLTKPLIFGGEHLRLNLSTSIRGGVRVELQDGEGTPLPGFSLADCETILDDSIEHVVRWKDGKDVGNFAGQPVRIRFELRDSDIYSLKFD